MQKKILCLFLIIFLLLAALPALAVPAAPADADALVYVIPVDSSIDAESLALLSSGYEKAEAAGADWVVLRINSYGGTINDAISMKDIIVASPLPTACFVDGKAISAATLVALAGEVLVMSPASTIGSAEPRNAITNEPVDEKMLSMWTAELRSTAEMRGRDGEVAAAMADSSIMIPDVIERDRLLTLTAQTAADLGMAEFILSDVDAVLVNIGMEKAEVVELDQTARSKIYRVLTNAWIQGLFLAIGIAGIVLELLTAGFGVAGTVGILSFAAFFVGNLLGGYTNIGVLLLFLVGLLLICIEIFAVPGFGVPGIAGILIIVLSVFLAAPSLEQAALSFVIALVLAVLFCILGLKFIRKRRVWNKLVLGMQQTQDEGYSSQSEDLKKYMGHEGRAVSILRPAGIAEIDGVRLDVVTTGDFISSGARVKVILVDGNRIVVREVK